MADGELCFKNAFKKYLNKIDCLKDSQNKEFSCDNKSDCGNKRNLLEHVENMEKLQISEKLNKVITESKYPDTEKIELNQMSSNSEEKQKHFPKDCDNFLTEQITLLKSLCLSEKDSSVRNRSETTPDLHPMLLESSALFENFINDVSETGDKLKISTKNFDEEAHEDEQFFISNVSGNIHDNGAKKHFSDTKICDTSAAQISSYQNEHYIYLQSADNKYIYDAKICDTSSAKMSSNHNEHSIYLQSAENKNFYDAKICEISSAQISSHHNQHSIYLQSANKYFYDAKICDTSVAPISSHHNEHFHYLQPAEKKHFYEAKICDTSAAQISYHNEHSQYLKAATEIECDTACTRVLIKQVHQELEQYRKLFISNFDENIDTGELYYYFLQFGEIERTISIRKPKARSKYIGYIIIFNNSDSVTAVQKAEPHVFSDRTLKLYSPNNDGCEPEEFCKLFVGNLNSRTTENDLLNHFRRWGTIINCVITRKLVANISKCYGSVTFKLFSEMNDALVFSNHRIRGRNVKVLLFEKIEGPQKVDKKFSYSNINKHKEAKGSQRRDKKSSYSNINKHKGFLTESQMLATIEKSKTFKPMVLNYELNDFDGAGVNIFKHTPLSKMKSNDLNYIRSSSNSALPLGDKLEIE